MITRRDLLRGVAGTAGLLGWPPGSASGEPPPETTRLRLFQFPGICLAPQYVAEDLLRAEGFTDVQYVEFPEGATNISQRLASGASTSRSGTSRASWRRSTRRCLSSSCPAYTSVARSSLRRTGSGRSPTSRGRPSPCRGAVPRHGLSSRSWGMSVSTTERTCVSSSIPPPSRFELLADGKIDAFMAVSADPQELRARKIGHVVRQHDRRPAWSQYFCCMIVANREFVRKHPVATKRAVRAILKAIEICAREPERVARAHRRSRVHEELRLRPPDDEGPPLWQVARVRSPRTRCASTRCACTRPG